MKIATNFRSNNVPHTKREALADDEKKRERTKDAKKKTNARTTNFHPGYGQIRSIDRSLFAAKRRCMAFMHAML